MRMAPADCYFILILAVVLEIATVVLLGMRFARSIVGVVSLAIQHSVASSLA